MLRPQSARVPTIPDVPRHSVRYIDPTAPTGVSKQFWHRRSRAASSVRPLSATRCCTDDLRWPVLFRSGSIVAGVRSFIESAASLDGAAPILVQPCLCPPLCLADSVPCSGQRMVAAVAASFHLDITHQCGSSSAMRTTLNVDDEILEAARSIAGEAKPLGGRGAVRAGAARLAVGSTGRTQAQRVSGVRGLSRRHRPDPRPCQET